MHDDEHILEGLEPTKNELRLLKLLRSLNAFEYVQITANNQGKADSYLVHRSTKVIFEMGSEPKPVKTRE